MFAAYACSALLIAALLILFFTITSYTKKARVTGLLQPESGVVRLHARESAIVRERRVDEGAQVRKGDVLFVLAAERVAVDGADADRELAAAIDSRRLTVERQAAAQGALRAQERAALQTRLVAARQQLDQAQADAQLQEQRARLAREAGQRQRDLVAQGFVTPAALQAKEAEELAEQSRALAAGRAVMAAATEVESLVASLREAPTRAAAEQAASDRALAALAQEAREHHTRREFAVRAPFDGVVTSIQAGAGQLAAPAVPLATLVPADSALQAHLYVPSRAVGFIEPGRPVRVRYQAYPYQKFGQHLAEVQSVAKAALSPQEVAALGLAPGGDTLYRVIVKLDSQHVMAYGQPQTLQAGMQLEADVLLDRRRLIEWVFEPLYSLAGRA